MIADTADITADVIVIGVGAVGSAALLALARAGVRALGIDRYAPPHDRGSSHGESRVIREATGEGEEFVPLVQRSKVLWRMLAEETGVELFRRCGFLAIDSSGGSAGRHGRSGFFESTVAMAEKFRIPFERPSTADVRYRFPAFLLDGSERLFFEPGAGVMFPERVIETQIARARELGATLVINEEVIGIDGDMHGVRVRTRDRTFHAGHAIVTAGAGITTLLPGLRPRLRLLRQTLHWFPTATSLFDVDRFPTFLWLHGTAAEDSFYGFPILPGGTSAVKLATEQFHDTTLDWDALERTVGREESAALHARTVGRLNRLADQAINAAACVYTHTQDGRFLIEAHPDSPNVTIVSACSGHGFKHSAAVGEKVAALVRVANSVRG